MIDKYIVFVEKNLDKISESGKKLHNIIKDKNQTFKAFKKGDCLFIDVTEYHKLLKKELIMLEIIEGKFYWVSDFENTKNKENGCHTFCILENKQLEFEF